MPTLAHAADPETTQPVEPDVIVIFHDAFNTYQDIQPPGVTHHMAVADRLSDTVEAALDMTLLEDIVHLHF